MDLFSFGRRISILRISYIALWRTGPVSHTNKRCVNNHLSSFGYLSIFHLQSKSTGVFLTYFSISEWASLPSQDQIIYSSYWQQVSKIMYGYQSRLHYLKESSASGIQILSRWNCLQSNVDTVDYVCLTNTKGGVADGSMISTPRTQWDAWRESVLCLRSIHTPLNKSWRAGGLHTEGRAIESLPVSSRV